MMAWAIRVNWEFFDHGENWGDSDVQEIMRETLTFLLTIDY